MCACARHPFTASWQGHNSSCSAIENLFELGRHRNHAPKQKEKFLLCSLPSAHYPWSACTSQGSWSSAFLGHAMEPLGIRSGSQAPTMLCGISPSPGSGKKRQRPRACARRLQQVKPLGPTWNQPHGETIEAETIRTGTSDASHTHLVGFISHIYYKLWVVGALIKFNWRERRSKIQTGLAKHPGLERVGSCYHSVS